MHKYVVPRSKTTTAVIILIDTGNRLLCLYVLRSCGCRYFQVTNFGTRSNWHLAAAV